MPWSADEGKPWIVDRVVKYQPWTVLDVGAGSGTYEMLLRPLLPGSVFVALEVWEPYVDEFQLDQRYDSVIIGDARCLAWPECDVVILGDVLEHMPVTHAEKVWSKARRKARRAVFASVPIIDWPQGPHGANEYERHVATWTHAQVLSMPGVVASEVGEMVGVYEVAPAIYGGARL